MLAVGVAAVVTAVRDADRAATQLEVDLGDHAPLPRVDRRGDVLSTPLRHGRTRGRRTRVTAVEFGLYAVLAPAVPLLVRRRADALLVLGALVAWSTAATRDRHRAVARLGHRRRVAAGRPPAFVPRAPRLRSALGHGAARRHRRRLLGDATIATFAAAAVARRRRRRGRLHSRRSDARASSASCRRRRSSSPSPPAITCSDDARSSRHSSPLRSTSLGIVALRARDFDQFFRFLGVKQTQTSTSSDIQTYSQRTLLAYIGVAHLARPPDRRRRLAGRRPSRRSSARHCPRHTAASRDVAERAFPGPGHEYGIQILYVQALADLGLIGFVFMLGWLGRSARVRRRAALARATRPRLDSGARRSVARARRSASGSPSASSPACRSTRSRWLAIGTIAAGLAASSTRDAQAGCAPDGADGTRHRRSRASSARTSSRAARARRRRARARQLLDRQPREPRWSRRRDRRRRAAQLRARAQRRARHRGRLPPRCARLGAAIGAGSADVERGQHRRNAQRPARCARRRDSQGGLLLVDLGLRLDAGSCRRPRTRRPIRSRRTASRSSQPSGTA